MTEYLFISDLHLSAERPQITALFLNFLKNRALKASHLYILGDFFDVWIGDDDQSEPIPEVIKGLSKLHQSGVEVSFLGGNRDFVLAEGFAKQCHLKLLPEKVIINYFQQKILLMHGDQLCTDDIQYQQARLQLRNPAFIADFLAKPLEQRRAIAAQYRQMSGEAASLLADDIIDVNQQAVLDTLKEFSSDYLIHGHTHRQNIHQIDQQNIKATRVVLGDWHETEGNVFVINQQNQQFESISLKN